VCFRAEGQTTSRPDDSFIKENLIKSTLNIFEAKMLKMNENNILLLLNLDKKIQVLQEILLRNGMSESTSKRVTDSSNENVIEERKDKTVRFQIESESLLNLNTSSSKDTESDESSFLRNRRLKSKWAPGTLDFVDRSHMRLCSRSKILSGIHRRPGKLLVHHHLGQRTPQRVHVDHGLD
jgi:hypothetical protein